MVLWFAAFGMKSIDYISVAILVGVSGMASSDFCCVTMPP